MFGHMNCGDIPWNLGLKNRPEIYGIGTSNESDPELWPLTLGPSKHMGRFHKLGPWNPFVGCVLRPLCNTHTQKIPNIDHIDTKSSALGISWLIFTHPTGKPIIKPKVFSTNQGIAFWRSTMASKQHPTFSPMSFPTRNLHLWDLPYFHIYFPYIFPWCSHDVPISWWDPTTANCVPWLSTSFATGCAPASHVRALVAGGTPNAWCDKPRICMASLGGWHISHG